ncbi:bifunctional 4-hydroxy-2-oxoglutarate aldolase/2-dehydro-3-deoxy-phosphogluconate aldolase [Xanthomonas translucens pv. undulosa]|uniref:bifunctional 4-hydroxy-2-oxoglutarate aldolase/2-dehydro-3-deoxy-phosphogluconate aldolase n=1 Tax=Xanthomonas campestris pv. translucens TaxID=343 RepID=UPI00071E7163|nr:bifunctional 4-hydroxy-2-oxoglutarate aldolase/2-dehydro-3-deoxy-phosphogluconate aldolase [Xanthomonas translucens]QEO26352.1 bifunctional 4-hydroxy-2-oxoglutarate aldolase/2-dehydro-3-deoxy-phosphogluconate aldolase [Xanthomonas translucens pv. undulosa]QSQ53945.1 bifunctional 4-hydroxy-2-oxoglutarate aldolase/2-dehydro-3-deoxy-phosphogluconate aldolase [Xanthomonas translucens pv. undulosa]QSQ60434.1 bifunctional 4-hydroxy-2-oxoglutarate aldolase/2-dehydro-3-deoxy-phosphogluconate aldolase
MTIAEYQNTAEQLLRAAGILPVVTVHSLDEARRVSAALLEGGLPAIELTLRTPVAMDALAMLKRELPHIKIGAGTVLTETQLQQAIDAGADFIVTPGTPPALAEALVRAPLPVVPGAATPTELLALMARGFRVCKLFPATAVGGLAMLKGLAGPLADLKLCPTGGIGESTAAEYLAQPNVVCIGGSWMVPKDWLANGAWDKVRESAAKAAEIVRGTRDSGLGTQ